MTPDHNCTDNLDGNCRCKICGAYAHDFDETRTTVACNRFECGFSWFNCGQVPCPPDVSKTVAVTKKCRRCGFETREEYEE